MASFKKKNKRGEKIMAIAGIVIGCAILFFMNRKASN
jgi:hypothetical protein